MSLPWNWAEVDKTKESLKLLRNFGQMCFEKRMKIMENEEVPNDILTSILKQFRNDDSLTIEDLIDDFITFFIAGQETTSNAVSFVLLMLADHPEIRDR
ncbi:cholesterol 24-hydroxylase-like [Tubulanus polymorphus]|uniref:cholesterol 24-hydroxylase-like n=1 Tax=Tubulanus polymorphus TaxID=672921 RepID=UPI003DA29C57